MHPILPSPNLHTYLPSKTILITGAAHGIGLATAQLFHSHGSNVVLADLLQSRAAAERAIKALPLPPIGDASDASHRSAAAAQNAEEVKPRAIFVPCDVTSWASLTTCFRSAIEIYGGIDVVVANAGIMETGEFWKLDEVDEEGVLRENEEMGRVVDVNLKGVMNMRLALHHMRHNSFSPSSLPSSPIAIPSRGSIVIFSSTSGYFGRSGVASYVASKHGVIGFLRASQGIANKTGVRINAVAPYLTSTHMTASFATRWREEGLPENSVEDVAGAVLRMAVDEEMRGRSCLIAGGKMFELEGPREEFTREWVGEEVMETMIKSSKMFEELGGYPLPKPRTGGS